MIAGEGSSVAAYYETTMGAENSPFQIECFVCLLSLIYHTHGDDESSVHYYYTSAYIARKIYGLPEETHTSSSFGPSSYRFINYYMGTNRP